MVIINNFLTEDELSESRPPGRLPLEPEFWTQ